MNPKATQLAMEQMRRMTPEQMSKIQQQMGSVSPEMMQAYMGQMKNMSDSEWDSLAGKMQTVDVDTLTNMPGSVESHFNAQQECAYKASSQLKEEGNKLFKAHNFSAAAEKYKRAKSNLEASTRVHMQDLHRACTLNLANCYLNLSKFGDCIEECTQVLKVDSKNVKALYRRGLANKSLYNYASAQQDLEIAAKLSTGDPQQVEMIEEKLHDIKKQIQACDGKAQSADEKGFNSCQPREALGDAANESTGIKVTEDQMPEEISKHDRSDRMATMEDAAALVGKDHGKLKEMVKENPEMLKDAADMMSKMSDDDLVSMGKCSGLNVSPEMLRVAQSAMSDMDLGTLKQMAKMVEGMPRRRADRLFDPPSTQSSSNNTLDALDTSDRPAAKLENSLASNVSAPSDQGMFTPEMMKMATEMMSNLSPEDLSAMSKMAGNMQSSSQSVGPTPDSLMNNPDMMRNMFKMMRSMDEDTVAGMLISSNMVSSKSQALDMVKKMKNLTDAQAETMIKVASGAQTAVRLAKKGKEILLGKPAFVIAIICILVGVFLRYMGWM